MSEKRKDNKGRLLRTGESQRKDLSYMYRYKDNDGTRKSVYAPTLAELREKEEEIAQLLRDGVIAGKKMTVIELVDQYLATKQNIKYTTMRGYRWAESYVAGTSFAQMDIGEVTRSSVKAFYVALSTDGAGFNTIRSVSRLLQSSFKQAVEDDLLVKSPCSFPLATVIKDDTKKREAIPEEELNVFLEFLKGSTKYRDYYGMVALLAYTGLRVSEACALTLDDIDLGEQRICVNKQVGYKEGRQKCITSTKTKTSVRYVSIRPELMPEMRRMVLAVRARKSQPMLDGFTRFLFVTPHGSVYSGGEMGDKVEAMWQACAKKTGAVSHRVTPHVLRHTFCTMCIQHGIDVKSTQYLMGHATPDMTLNVYSHSSYEMAKEAFVRAYGS